MCLALCRNSKKRTEAQKVREVMGVLVTHDLLNHYKKFGICFELNRKPLQVFLKRRGMLYIYVLKRIILVAVLGMMCVCHGVGGGE